MMISGASINKIQSIIHIYTQCVRSAATMKSEKYNEWQQNSFASTYNKTMERNEVINGSI